MLSAILSVGAFVVGCADTGTKTSASTESSGATIIDGTHAFTKTDVKVGTGATAATGQQVSVHYTGWLYDPSAANNRGKQFDSSRSRGRPFEFPLGAGRVIKGWDQGVVGMKVGGQRTLIIPSDMGYGARGAGSDIPPHATLVFDVELLDVK
ncbi:FKBP-type peptidyl-prolyl cis-trans isomerase [Leucothrix sargassi]|nr:FKBP-type peptidyl-prolyl cis-trans isomerase [Leucothrix sargassi]